MSSFFAPRTTPIIALTSAGGYLRAARMADLKPKAALKFWRAAVIALAVSTVAMSASPAQAESENVRLSVSLGTGAVYPPGRWLPLMARLTNPTSADIDGVVVIEPANADRALKVQRGVHVPANSTVSLETIIQLADQPPRKNKQKAIDAASVIWLDHNGRPLVTEPLSGLSDSSLERSGRDSTGMPGVVLLSVQDSVAVDNPRLDPNDLGEMLASQVAYSFDVTGVDVKSMPRHAEGLDGARLITLDPTAADNLDQAQREALLSAIRAGATLILTQPPSAAAASWIGQYVALDPIGTHRTTALRPKQYETLPLRASTLITDCIARDGATIIASDDRGPLAAFVSVGAGRIVTTAFDVNDLTPGPAVGKLWGDLIGIQRDAFHNPSSLTDKPAAAALLPAMIGAGAPPWRLAAGVVGGYVLVVAVLLLAAGQGRRPLAMVICVGGSVALTGALLGLTAARTSGTPLMIGRATTLDVSGGSALQHDIVTFYGQQRSDLAVDLAPGAIVSPVIANSEATMSLWPTRIGNVGASTGKLETVWNVSRSSPAPHSLAATLKFGPNGASLATQNGFDQPLQAPRLVNGGVVIPVGRVAEGNAEQPVGVRNAPGVYADSASVIADEQSKLRTDLLQQITSEGGPRAGLTFRQAKSAEPVLAGFMNLGATVKLSDSAESHEQTLVRTPLQIAAAPVGTEVRIDPAFNTVRQGIVQSLPYSTWLNAWSESNLTGAFTIAIAPPRDVGHLKAKTLSLALDARAAGYHIAIRRGQCSGGKMRENPAGEIIAEWSNTTGPMKADVSLADSDIDANGWVWLRIDVQNAATTTLMGDTVTGNWQLMRWDATLTGTIDAPPQPEIMTWPAPEPPPVHKPAPPKTPAKPTTKPTNKSTTKPAKAPAKPAPKK